MARLATNPNPDFGLTSEEVNAFKSVNRKLARAGVRPVEADWALKFAIEQEPYARNRSVRAEESRERNHKLIIKASWITPLVVIGLLCIWGMASWWGNCGSPDAQARNTYNDRLNYEQSHTLTNTSTISLTGWRLNNDKADLATFRAENKPPDSIKTVGTNEDIHTVAGALTFIRFDTVTRSDNSNGVKLIVVTSLKPYTSSSTDTFTLVKEEWVLPLGHDTVVVEDPYTHTKNYLRVRRTNTNSDDNSPVEIALWNAK